MAIVRLDLDALVAAGELTPAQAKRLRARAVPGPLRRVWISYLLILGAIAVAAGAIALVPTARTGLALALASLGGAEGLRRATRGPPWDVLAAGCALMGVLGVAGWVGIETSEIPDAVWPPMLIAAVLTAGAVWYRSAFLAALAVLAMGAVLGAGTVYWYASYGLIVREPTLTILAFGALAAGLYGLRGRLRAAWRPLATAAARTAVFLTQFGFWVGSLWGDFIGEHWAAGSGWQAPQAWRDTAVSVPELVFSVGWAAVLVTVIVRAPRGGFLSVTAIVFLAIHAYTQYFEVFGTRPWGLVFGGLAAVAGAAGAAWWLARRAGQAPPPSGGDSAAS